MAGREGNDVSPEEFERLKREVLRGLEDLLREIEELKRS